MIGNNRSAILLIVPIIVTIPEIILFSILILLKLELLLVAGKTENFTRLLLLRGHYRHWRDEGNFDATYVPGENVMVGKFLFNFDTNQLTDKRLKAHTFEDGHGRFFHKKIGCAA